MTHPMIDVICSDVYPFIFIIIIDAIFYRFNYKSLIFLSRYNNSATASLLKLVKCSNYALNIFLCAEVPFKIIVRSSNV